jgi:hypothetical protein
MQSTHRPGSTKDIVERASANVKAAKALVSAASVLWRRRGSYAGGPGKSGLPHR